MIFKKLLKRKVQNDLISLVSRVSDTGYIFVDINNDLGGCAEKIMASSESSMMAYGYARRAAIAALYVQGIVDKDAYNHVVLVFKSLQIQTGHTVEFQESAADLSVSYMQEYSHVINRLFMAKIIDLAENYGRAPGKLSDEALIASVFETIYAEQQDRLRPKEPELNRDEILKKLRELSNRDGNKTQVMQILPSDGSHWGCRVKLSDGEVEEAQKLVALLFDLTDGGVSAPIFQMP